MSETFERLVDKICLERGWATHEHVIRCLVELADSPPGPSRPKLSDLLVARGFVDRAKMDAAREEFERHFHAGPDVALDRKEEDRLGQILVEGGDARREDLQAALAEQKRAAGAGGPVPRLGLLLLERGHATYSAVLRALRRQRERTRLQCRACRTIYSAQDYDPRRKYACKRCAGPLVPLLSAPELPEEVRRSAQDPSRVMGRYVAIEPVGRGGMGVVYRGYDCVLHRPVALKTLTGPIGEEELRRFQLEAEACAALHHPNIVSIHDRFTHDGREVIAMEFIDGASLHGRRMSPEEAARVAVPIARALHHAHTRGILHRDIKPANILVDRGGRPVLTDFGLAKSLRSDAHATTAMVIVGTPTYVSPEQAQGAVQPLDGRTDVWSLGAVLYELLAGRPPFGGSDAWEVLHRVVHETLIPPSRFSPRVPKALEAIVVRCLEKDRDRRYPTAEALADDLELFLSGGFVAPPPGRARLRRRFRRP